MPRVEIGELVMVSSGTVPTLAGKWLLAASGATVQVNLRAGGAATVYAAATGATTLANPLTSDSHGRVEGWLDEGSYDLVVSVGGASYTQRFEAASGATVAAFEAVRVVMAAPTGVAATDEASWTAAKAIIDAAGGTIEFRPSSTVYSIRPASGGKLLIPNNCKVVIPAGCTVQATANIATGAGNYVLFAGAGAPPTNVHIVLHGILDGNRRDGNHGLSEDIHAITMSEGQNCSFAGEGRIYNWRGEGIYCGQTGGGSGGTAPKNCKVLGLTFNDVGIKESGDSGNPRQGVAFVSGTNILVDDCVFDTVGGYAIDFEGDFANNHFESCIAGPGNTFRNCGQGSVNVTTPGTVYPSVRAFPVQIAGPQSTADTTNASANLTNVSPTTGWTNGCAVSGTGIPTGTYIVSGAGTATMVMSQNATATAAGVAIDGVPSVNLVPIPTSRARVVRKRRFQAGDITLNSGSWADVSNADFDITMPAQVGDIIKYEPNMLLSSVADFTQFDVAVVVAGSVVRYFSSETATPLGSGVAAWRLHNITGQNWRLSGAVMYVVQAGDVRNGLITLRFRYDQGTGTAQTLFTSAAAADAAAMVMAENLGPGW